ncbi:MAG: hypothetical protein PHW76_09570, partial [Alphaproteobacteria bacterium]|nr:hypothetical protein [Alphaproteobacteria bacterium]
MFRWTLLLGFIGLAAATAVIAWTGFNEVVQALAHAGWRGIFAVSAYHIIPLAVSSFGWQILVPGKKRPGLAEFTYFMWIRAAINDFLP